MARIIAGFTMHRPECDVGTLACDCDPYYVTVDATFDVPAGAGVAEAIRLARRAAMKDARRQMAEHDARAGR